MKNDARHLARRCVERLSLGLWLKLRRRFNATARDVINGQPFEYRLAGDIGRALYLTGRFEQEELEICRRFIDSTSTVIDIGANIGVHTTYFAQLAKGGMVISFEPEVATFEILARNVEHLENVVAMNLAVGPGPAVRTFFIASDGAFSSLKDTRRKPILRTSRVVSLPIDVFLPALERVDFVKVDVEGLEHDVLMTMHALLERDRPTLFVEIYGGENSNPDPARTVETLRALGYEAFVMDEGRLVEYRGHDDDRYNYLFVHPDRPGHQGVTTTESRVVPHA